MKQIKPTKLFIYVNKLPFNIVPGQAGRGPRYTIGSSVSGETLTVRAVEVSDGDVYRCYPFTAQSDVRKTTLTVLGKRNGVQRGFSPRYYDCNN